MDYYSNKLCLAQVDKNDQVLDQVERWEAHEKGILHRGFTVILFYKNQLVLQHRKHPAFDKFWDLTFSSHQEYLKDGRLQDDLSAIYQSLKREWNIDKNGLTTEPKFLGKIYYKAKDPNSIYTEHEIDHIYSAQLKDTPTPNREYAYGFQLAKNPLPLTPNPLLPTPLAPWVEKILQEISII